MTKFRLSDSDDIINVRDMIARYEELESERDDLALALAAAQDDIPNNDSATAEMNLAGLNTLAAVTDWNDSEDGQEFEALDRLLSDLKDCGGDEQWRDDWYPITLIRHSYWTTYAEELVTDCGGLPKNLPDWIVIDWEATACNLKQDYSCVDIDRIEYWYR